MKGGLILIIFLLSILAVSALEGDISKSKYSSDVFKIKFDDNPNSIVYNKSSFLEFGCGADGRFFVEFDVESSILKTDDISLRYKIFGVPGSEKELKGTYYKRNLQTGKFESVSGKLFDTFQYYFWSDPVFTDNDYVIKVDNLEGEHREKTLYIHCPEPRYTCADFKSIVSCYNTNDEKLVIEFSGANIQDNEQFGLSDLFIHTKGTNERAELLNNTLSVGAKMYEIGKDKYRIITPLLYGDPKDGTNVINYVYFQPKSCFYDLYPEAYVTPKCGGIKEISSSELLAENQITGAAVAETSTGSNYWVYGLVLLTLIVVVVLVIRRKK
ncbi:hypothetical protein J4427_00780 [Candidatus Woesearchaeota archaeon]|nr:hypothetical protein [Candidatus Woesearchaeota archaeon]